jgi:hypothetical protein
MDDRIKQYLQAYQLDVITAAEAKLERPLLPEEKAGIDNLWSGMQLEGLYQAFSYSSTSKDEVVRDLAYFAAQPPGTFGSV